MISVELFSGTGVVLAVGTAAGWYAHGAKESLRRWLHEIGASVSLKLTATVEVGTKPEQPGGPGTEIVEQPPE